MKLASLALFLAPLLPEEFEVAPEPLPWEALSEAHFDRAWTLPATRTSPGRDLLAEMRTLLEITFDFEDSEGRRYRCFGDLVATSRDLEPAQREAWFLDLRSRAPELMDDWGAGLRELLFDEELKSLRWNPARDSATDGLLLAETWDLGVAAGEPWRSVRVRPLMEQAATLISSDLATIKAVENDYRLYPENVAADYEEIFPLAGTYRLGRDPGDRPFSTLTIRFECDLPFPFSGYTTVLDIFNYFDADGVLRTDIHSASPDFHWLAGRDVFLPVEDSAGDWVAFLVVRHFGFDLDDVPDKSKHRQEALRGSLGNLKLNAERAWRAVPDRRPENGPEFLEDVKVFGRR